VSLRAPPGLQISTGRLRVDAARAIAKLREYQLVDRMAWVLEAIRGAVALGATTIELTGDANDVWLRWTGTPLAAEDLARLFDELVSPEPTADRHGIRLLASAVNSALGTDPAYVKLTAIDDSSAASIAFTPDLLEAPEHELGEAPLRALEVRTVTPSPGAARGMLVHLRRRATLDVVQNFFRGEPPELAIARAHCQTISVPLRIGNHTFDPGQLGDDILRVPLGNDLHGFVAVVDPATRTADGMGVIVEIAERGVVLERFEDAFGVPTLLHPMPLRLVIDAPKQPTNASRSEVRRNQHPISTGLARARDLVPKVVAELVREVTKDPPDPRARGAAIALVATHVAGGNWKELAQQLRGPLAKLANVPLLFNAVGEQRPIRAPWAWSTVYHDGAQPLPRELAPWVAAIEVTPQLLATLSVVLPRKLELRGVMWLERTSEPCRFTVEPAVRVRFGKKHEGGVCGRFYAYSPTTHDFAFLPPLIAELYRRLVRTLADAGPLDDDLVQAHVAQALALEDLTPAEVPTYMFSCFESPLSSDQLFTLMRSYGPAALVDDGSETYRVLHKWLGVRRPASGPPPLPPAPVVYRSPPKRHRLADLVDAIHQRALSLGVRGPHWTFVDDREEPLVQYRDSTLELAARNPQVLAIAAAHLARSGWASDAIDLLVAHVITVLNEARAAVTDAAEAAALARLLD
jgi:hypothetical protein